MRKALVSFPIAHNEIKNVESSIIENHEHIQDYKEEFPSMYPLVVKNFIDIVEGGGKVIVNKNGGWCTPEGQIQIVEYLDEDKKTEVKMNFLNLLMDMGMDKPSNFDAILEYIYNDVCETADEKNWSVCDVVIGFRRWIEAQS